MRGGSEELSLCSTPTADDVAFVGAKLTEHNRAASRGRIDYPGEREPGLVINLAVRDPAARSSRASARAPSSA